MLKADPEVLLKQVVEEMFERTVGNIALNEDENLTSSPTIKPAVLVTFNWFDTSLALITVTSFTPNQFAPLFDM
jgi:hypothetical protein